MILNVNPNRMELIRLRKRLVLAVRGHRLLEDKLEQLMQKLLMLLKDIDAASEDFQKRTTRLINDLLYCRITSSMGDFQESLDSISPRLSLAISDAKIMNVQISKFDIKEFVVNKRYNFFKTSAQLDLVIADSRSYLESLLKLASLLNASNLLSYEIERTRRRVNALKYVLIPSVENAIRYISQKLNEFERGNLIRLMRVKEMVRSH